jgi:hypothetical protein
VANIHGNGKEIQYVSIYRLFSQHPCSNSIFEDSDVIYLRLLTTDFVVLNSSKVISDLTEKRSEIYSDRVSPSASLAQWC